MKRPFGSFLIRYWLLENARQMIEVEHIQSKRSTRVTSLVELTRWITAQMRDEAGQRGSEDELSPAQNGDVQSDVS